MSCERYEEGLIDHALGAPAAPEVQAHLAACATCRARLDEERRLAATMNGILASTLAVAPSPGFDLAVRRRVSGTRPARVLQPATWIGVGLAAAAAVILAVLLRPSPPPDVPAITEHVRPPQATSIPEAAPTAAPVIADERTARVVTPRRAVRQRASQPVEPEVLVPPTQPREPALLESPVSAPALVIARYMAQFEAGDTSERVLASEPVKPFVPIMLEVGALRSLPRAEVVEIRYVEPTTPLDRLVTGGES
jgi:hypothetical protein